MNIVLNKQVLFFGPIKSPKAIKLDNKSKQNSCQCQLIFVQKKNSGWLIKNVSRNIKLVIYFKGKDVDIDINFIKKHKEKIALLIGNFKMRPFPKAKDNAIAIKYIKQIEHLTGNKYYSQLIDSIIFANPSKLLLENVYISNGDDKGNYKGYCSINDVVMSNKNIVIPKSNIGINTILKGKSIIFMGPGPLSSRAKIDYKDYDYLIITHHMITLFKSVIDKYPHLKLILFFNHYYATNHKKEIKTFINGYKKRITKIICRKLSVKLFTKIIERHMLLCFKFKEFYNNNPLCHGPLSLTKILYSLENSDCKVFRITGITFYSDTNVDNNYVENYRVDKTLSYDQQFMTLDKKHNLSDNAAYLKQLIKKGLPIVLDAAIINTINKLSTSNLKTTITKNNGY